MVHAIAISSSSTSLGMAVSPKIIEALDNSIRDELQRTSHGFFVWVLMSAFVVAIGVALEGPEILHEMWPRFFSFFTRGSIRLIRKFKRIVKNVGFWGWLLVVVGVAGEGIFEGLQNRAEGQLQTFNDILLADAQRNAGNARVSAIDAANAAGRANSESKSAAVSSSNAVLLAQGASKEADSFAEEIASAKNEAANAVSRLASAEKQLADATQREADAEAALKRLKTPRSLFNADGLVAGLRSFKGTEYTMNVAQDDEAFQLTKDIDKALNAAGWIRKQPQGHSIGITYFNVFSQDFKDGVPVCVATGVTISVRSKDSLESLQSRPSQYLPKTVRAALILNNGLAASILPSDDHNVDKGVIDPMPGEEGPMQICVGRKP
jgi:hypothetical protein